MACSSCGDAVAPKCDKNFTETVVKINNPSKIILFRKVVIPASMGDETTLPPTVGKYRNVLLEYEATEALYLYSSDGIPTQISVDVSELMHRINELGIEIHVEKEERIAGDEALSDRIDSLSSSLSDEAEARQQADAVLQGNIDAEARARKDADDGLSADIVAEAQARVDADEVLDGKIDDVADDLSDEVQDRRDADNDLQSQIDAVVASSDVKDIVGTHAELENYDTSTLGNNDIIKVLQDETQNDATTYYRWSTQAQTFSLIGTEGPYYTKSQTNVLLDEKQDTLTAGTNIQISHNVISATDTTYTAGNGINIDNYEISADIYPEDYFTGDTTSCEEGTTIEAESPIGLASAQLKGNTTQQTYSGKNLYNYLDTSSVDTGVTTDSDGWITITADNSSGSGPLYKNYYTNPIPQLVANTQYDIFLEVKSVTGNAKLNLVDNASSSQFQNDVIFQFADLSDNTTYKASSTTKTDLSGRTLSIRTFGQYAAGKSGTITFRITVAEHSDTTAQDFIYEPYVGGIPAPNPDYPQTVNTVTGRQVVTISDGDSQSQSYEVNLGKNLLDESTMEAGSFNYLVGNLFASSVFIRSQKIPCLSDTTYTFSANVALGEFAVVYYAKDGSTVVPGEGSTVTTNSVTYTTPSGAYYMRVKTGGNSYPRTMNEDYDLQIELGSTATSYAPYFEPIELCKIGDYQDYIYKSGGDWYLHKAIGKVDFGTLTWTATTSAIRGTVDIADIKYVSSNTEIGSGIAQKYIIRQGSGLASYQNYIAIDTAKVNVNTGSSSIDPTGLFYYALANATDTQITNADLIAQLEALLGATTYDGQTVFTVSGPNQLTILNVCTFNKTLDGTLAKIDSKQDKLTAGNAIDITNDVISAAVYPEDYFTNENATVSGTGTDIELEGTTELSLKNIDLLGDTAQQTYTGKNKVNINASFPITTETGLTLALDDEGWITINGTASANLNIHISDDQKAFLSQYDDMTMTLSYEESGTGSIDNIGLKQSGGANIFVASPSDNPHTDTFDIDSKPTAEWMIWTKSGTVFNNYKIRLQLETGSTKTDYEPFVGGIPAPNPDYPQPVQTVTGIQNIEFSDGMGGSKDYTVELTATRNVFNSRLEINGISGSGGTQGMDTRASSTDFTYVTPGETYTLNLKAATEGKTAQAIIRVWDKNGQWVTSLPSDAWYTLPFTVTMPSNAYKIKLSLRYSDNTIFGTVGDLTDAFEDIQLERGETATEYQPFEPIELCKVTSISTAPSILKYQDYIYKNGSDWYIHKEVVGVTFDGTESWQAHNTHNNINSFSYYTDAAHSNSAIVSDSFYTVYITTYNSDSNRSYATIATLEATTTSTTNTVFMTAPNSSVTTLAQFKEWLGSNPVKAYYAVATPTEIKITNETLLSQLDALASAITYPDRTMITVSSDNTKVILNASAFTRGYSGTIEAINTKGSGNANVNIGYGLEKSGSTISVDTDEIATKSDLVDNKVAQEKEESTDGNFPVLFKHTNNNTDETAGVHYRSNFVYNPSTGKATAPAVATTDYGYIYTHKIRGQGDTAMYTHAIDLGYSTHDMVDWYEYGGIWNFWRNRESTATTDTANLALGITLNALKNKAYTYTFPDKTGTFALTSDLPTVNNATLTIQNNGGTVDTFTANASTNKTINIVPATMKMADFRTSLTPTDATNNSVTAFFTTEGGLDSQTNNSKYCDAILMCGWGKTDSSGGRINLLAATKSNPQALYHYTGSANGATWSAKKKIAYEDTVPVITMTTTDPGEGSALAANHFIAVYEA